MKHQTHLRRALDQEGLTPPCLVIPALQSDDMTAEAKHLVDDFRALPDAAKREVLAELVRISGRIDYPAVSDDELLATANDVFLGYDEREGE
jgi:hypothetical protein